MDPSIDAFFDLLEQPHVRFHEMQEAFRSLTQKHRINIMDAIAKTDDVDRLKKLINTGLVRREEAMNDRVWWEEKSSQCVQFFKNASPNDWIEHGLQWSKNAIRAKDVDLFQSILTMVPELPKNSKLFGDGAVEQLLVYMDWSEGVMLWWELLKEEEKSLFLFSLVTEECHRCVHDLLQQKTHDWQKDESVLFFYAVQTCAYKPTDKNEKMLLDVAKTTSPNDAMVAFARRTNLNEVIFGRTKKVFEKALSYMTSEGCYTLEKEHPHIPWGELGEEFQNKTTKHALFLQTKDIVQDQPSQRRYKM